MFMEQSSNFKNLCAVKNDMSFLTAHVLNQRQRLQTFRSYGTRIAQRALWKAATSQNKS
jgi:hypothetical protein